MKELNTDLLKIINYFGVSNQQKKLSEEIYELQEAIFNIENDEMWKYESNLEDLIGELADVLVLIRQIQLEYKISDEDIILTMRKKVDRTIKRILEGYYK